MRTKKEMLYINISDKGLSKELYNTWHYTINISGNAKILINYNFSIIQDN